jgi:hypothetical protein
MGKILIAHHVIENDEWWYVGKTHQCLEGDRLGSQNGSSIQRTPDSSLQQVQEFVVFYHVPVHDFTG